MRNRNTIRLVVAIGLMAIDHSTAYGQFLTPVREKPKGGSVIQIGGIGSVSAGDLDKLANNASAQITIVARPARWAELYGSFNRGAGLSKIAADSYNVSGLLFPEGSTAGFLGQAEAGPHWATEVGGVPARFDVTAFGNFATRRDNVTIDGSDKTFSGGSAGAGAKLAFSVYPVENNIRILVGVGYNRIFFNNTDVADARIALRRANLPRAMSGIRTVVAAQINALVVEAQLPNLSGGGVNEKDLTGFQPVVRFYVVGKFLSFGSFGN